MTGGALIVRAPYARRTDMLGIAVGTAWGVATLAGGLDNYAGLSIAYIVLLVTGMVALLAIPRDRSFWRDLLGVLTPFLLALCWMALVSTRLVFDTARAPDLLLPALLGQAAILMALGIGAMLGASSRPPHALISTLIAMGMATLAIALLSRSIGIDGVNGVGAATRHGRFAGTLQNANAAGTQFAVLALFALGCAVTRGRPAFTPCHIPTFAIWITVVAMTGACIITASRMANLGMVAGFVVIAARYGAISRQNQQKRSILLAIATIIMVLVALFAQPLFMRAEIASNDLAQRQFMWQHYGDIALQSPLSGFGLGSFPAINAQFLSDPWIAQQLWMVNSPHNFLVQQVLRGGLPALALLVAGMMLLLGPISRAVIYNRWSAMDLGLAMAVLVLVIEGMVDIAFDMPVVALLTALLVGLLWGISRRATIGIGHANQMPAVQERHVSRA